jgi:hypothetical protein
VKCSSIDDARLVFDRLEKHNVITWNVILGNFIKVDLFFSNYTGSLQNIWKNRN